MLIGGVRLASDELSRRVCQGGFGQRQSGPNVYSFPPHLILCGSQKRNTKPFKKRQPPALLGSALNSQSQQFWTGCGLSRVLRHENPLRHCHCGFRAIPTSWLQLAPLGLFQRGTDLVKSCLRTQCLLAERSLCARLSFKYYSHCTTLRSHFPVHKLKPVAPDKISVKEKSNPVGEG